MKLSLQDNLLTLKLSLFLKDGITEEYQSN